MYLDLYIKSVSNMCFLSTPRILKSVFGVVKYCKDFVILCNRYDGVKVGCTGMELFSRTRAFSTNWNKAIRRRSGYLRDSSRLPRRILQAPTTFTSCFCGSTTMGFIRLEACSRKWWSDGIDRM